VKTKFRPEAITFVTALYFVAVLNAPFWQLLYRFVDPNRAEDWFLLAVTALALVVLFNLALMLIAVRPLFRLVLAVLLPVTAAASYFMHEYGIIIDHHMVRNVIVTNSSEAGDLMTTTLLLYVVALGIVPAVVLWNLPWVERPLKNDIKLRVKIAAASMVMAAAAVFPVWGDVISTFRAHRELRLTLTPSNYIGSIAKYARLRSPQVPADVAKVGGDAERHDEPQARPHLFVVVVGETARADHFALNGYARPTTPELAKVPGLINYAHATSCGTDTAHSVPCMFSDLKQSGFTNAKAAARENLLDVLKRAGVDVVWRENQAGCKGVCERIATEVLAKPASAAFYRYRNA
jgi:lipid A ethanolaminephosphotransferase